MALYKAYSIRYTRHSLLMRWHETCLSLSHLSINGCIDHSSKRIQNQNSLIREAINGTVNGASNNGGPLETVDVVLGIDALGPTRENSYIIVSI